MNELTMDQAVRILQSRANIAQPGKYRVKVTGTTPYVREDGTAVQICNLAAMTQYHISEAKRMLNEGDIQSATNQNLTSSPRIGRDFCPQKGEFVDIIVDFVTTRDGQQALLVTNMSAVPVSQTTRVNAFSEFAESVQQESEVFDNATA
jgi:hypothetical protein